MKKLLTGIFAIAVLGGYAQQDFTMYNMRYLQQSNFLNPAFVPECKVNVGIPLLSGPSFRAGFSAFTWNDMVNLDANDSLEFTIDNALSKMKDRNYFDVETRVDLLHFGFVTGEASYLSFNVSSRQYFRLTMTDDFLRYLWEGNGKTFLGQRADMDGTALDLTTWTEYGIGYAAGISDNFTVGIRGKVLQGTNNVWTRKSQFGITTDERTYQLNLDGDMEYYTSGADTNGLRNPLSPFSPNLGFSVDLGLAYQFKEKVELSMSLIDFGYITWQEDNRNFAYNDVDLEFSGFDGFGGVLTTNPDNPNVSTDTLQATLTQLEDSVRAEFDPAKDSANYTTWLPTRFNFGARIQLGEKNFLGSLFSLGFAKGRLRPAFSFSYNYRVHRRFGAAISYSIYNRSYFNVGTGLSANLGPVQLHMIFDNILAPIMPQNVKNIHARLGLNLNFGCKEPRQVKRPGF